MLGATALLLAGAVGAWRLSADREDHGDRLESRARQSVMSIAREMRTRVATKQVEANGRGWPKTVDPAWFGGNLPLNSLLDQGRPWLEIASPDEHDLTHPRRRMAIDENDAAFWYNPALGVVRARVGPMLSDAAALDAYNFVNKSHVDELFDGGDADALKRAAEQRVAAKRESLKKPALKPDSVVQVRE